MAETKTEKLRISLEKPMPFEAMTKSKFMKPDDLCKLANNLFKSVFVDYVGCRININTPANNAGLVQFASVNGIVNDVPQNAYYLSLFFQDQGTTADPTSGQYNALNRLHGNSPKATSNNLSAAFDSFTETRSNPHQYALSAEAKELLEATEMRSSQIAQEVGYNDSHYFSYLFKKTTGMTPSEFRRSNQAGE